MTLQIYYELFILQHINSKKCVRICIFYVQSHRIEGFLRSFEPEKSFIKRFTSITPAIYTTPIAHITPTIHEAQS